MTSISSVNPNVNTQRGKQIGGTMGAAVSTGYLVKNRKDIFERAINDGISQLKESGVEFSKNKATAIAVGVGAVMVALVTGAGALIGAGIGKLVDKHNQNKQMKEFIANEIADNAKDVKAISVEELEELDKK